MTFWKANVVAKALITKCMMEPKIKQNKKNKIKLKVIESHAVLFTEQTPVKQPQPLSTRVQIYACPPPHNTHVTLLPGLLIITHQTEHHAGRHKHRCAVGAFEVVG